MQQKYSQIKHYKIALAVACSVIYRFSVELHQCPLYVSISNKSCMKFLCNEQYQCSWMIYSSQDNIVVLWIPAPVLINHFYNNVLRLENISRKRHIQICHRYSLYIYITNTCCCCHFSTIVFMNFICILLLSLFPKQICWSRDCLKQNQGSLDWKINYNFPQTDYLNLPTIQFHIYCSIDIGNFNKNAVLYPETRSILRIDILEAMILRKVQSINLKFFISQHYSGKWWQINEVR